LLSLTVKALLPRLARKALLVDESVNGLTETIFVGSLCSYNSSVVSQEDVGSCLRITVVEVQVGVAYQINHASLTALCV